MKKPKVIAVILTYNCASMLAKAYASLPKDLVDEIIVTDDGSKDEIELEAQKLGLKLHRHTPNRGYGGNVKAGIALALESGADYIVEVHGDGQFNPAALRDAMPYLLQGYEFVIGSRFIVPGRARELGMPLVRYLANRGLTFIDKLVLRLPFSEYHTGFRIYSRPLLERAAWQHNSNTHLFSFQIIAQAAYVNAKAAEVPAEADYRDEHTSHSLHGASLYAVRTFGVLARYILARAGIYYSTIFPKPDDAKSHTITRCQGCDSPDICDMFDLGDVPSVNAFLQSNELERERAYPLHVCWCRRCTLVQLKTIVSPEELFSHYQHLSSASQTNIYHLKELASTLKSRLHINDQTKIMDVGSNDGALLEQFLDVTKNVLGVDPAENLVSYAKEKGVEQVAAFFNDQTAPDIVRQHGKYDVVLALNVVAHTPDVRSLLRGIAATLSRDGTFVMESVYVFSTILNGEFDTVYHEHDYCFSLTALVPLFAKSGLTIVNVEQIETQGGSIRVSGKLTDSNPGVDASVSTLLRQEEALGVCNDQTYLDVGRRVEEFKKSIVSSLQELKRKHGRAIALGASARGVVILNACKIGTNLIDAIIDDTPLKQGCVSPGTHVPVISWDQLASMPATAFLLLSWNYEAHMLKKLREFVEHGEVLIPFPQIRTVSW